MDLAEQERAEQRRVECSRGEEREAAVRDKHKMPITATQLWVVSLLSHSLSLEIAQNYHCGEDEDVDRDVGNVDFKLKLKFKSNMEGLYKCQNYVIAIVWQRIELTDLAYLGKTSPRCLGNLNPLTFTSLQCGAFLSD